MSRGHAALVLAAAGLAYGGQAWIRLTEPVGFTLPPAEQEAVPTAVSPDLAAERPMDGARLRPAWRVLADELGPNALERVLRDESGVPAWRLAIATADPEFGVAAREAGVELEEPAVDASLSGLDLPGLRAWRSDEGTVGWRGPVGEIGAGDADALVGLLSWLDTPSDSVVQWVITVNQLAGYWPTRGLMTGEVYRMDGWERGPVIGREYSLVVRSEGTPETEIRFVATEDGGQLER